MLINTGLLTILINIDRSISTPPPGYNSYDSQRCDGLLADENANETESSQGTAQIAEDLPIIGMVLSILKRS
jgi:hypothetical protein